MKKLYKDIRFAKCILALTAGWLMAGCSAEDELGNGSAAQQLSMTPMINDLQTTRVKEEENLHEKTLSSLDFKMFEPTSSELKIDRQFDKPVENKAEELGSGNWKSGLHLDVDKTYPYYAVANAKVNLKGKNLTELLACTQQDDDIWMPATMVNDKKFLMSSQGEYTINQDPEQNIPVKLVRAAAKIKLNISSTVKDYHIKEVMWKFINYNTNTAIFANQPADQNIKKNIQENKATAEKDKNGNDIYKVTTYSYSTTWNGKDDMPQFVADVTFEKNTDANTTINKHLVIPVRDPQGEKKLDRNYIYTVNAVIKYLDTNTHIDYDDDLGYLKWQITKWTQGEETKVKGDKADYLIVYPTTISMKGMDDNDSQIDESIRWMASAECNIQDYAYYSFDSNGTIHKNENNINQPGGAELRKNTETGDGNCGYIKISAGYPAHNTIVYCTFNLCVNGSNKKQKIIVKKYPSIYSLNVESTGTLNPWQNKHLYTIQHSVTKSSNTYSVAKPSDKNDNTVSPAFIIASTINSKLQSIGSNNEAKKYCEQYIEKAKTKKGEDLDLSGWRLPTKEEVKKIISLQSGNNAIPNDLLQGESYWTFDGDKSEKQSNAYYKGAYVRCVHDLTPDEIEKIEDQGIE